MRIGELTLKQRIKGSIAAKARWRYLSDCEATHCPWCGLNIEVYESDQGKIIVCSCHKESTLRCFSDGSAVIQGLRSSADLKYLALFPSPGAQQVWHAVCEKETAA